MADNQPEESKRSQGVPGSNTLIRVGGKLVKRGAKKLTTTAIAETAPEWIVPAAILSLCAIVFFVIFGVITPGGVAGGDLSNNPPPTNPSSSMSPNPSINPNISAQLANDLVVTGSGASSQAIADVQSIMSIPYKSSAYRNLITSNGKYKVNIIISNSGSCGLNNTGGPGGKENAPINLLNWNCSFALREKILIHETGHVIAIRNGSLGFPLSTYSSPPNPDSSCYTGPGGYLRTYSYKSSVKGGVLAESFPEAVSDNIVPYPTGPQYGDTIPNYSTSCANTYNWIKNNIYGGVEF